MSPPLASTPARSLAAADRAACVRAATRWPFLAWLPAGREVVSDFVDGYGYGYENGGSGGSLCERAAIHRESMLCSVVVLARRSPEVTLDLPAVEAGAGALLSLLRFASPSLPIGAYAYSRALEYAVHAGSVHDEASAEAWIVGLAVHTTARLDAPILLRLQRAFASGDDAAVAHWNAFLLASRESSELRLEDTQLGAALARLLVGQGVGRARAFCQRGDVCYASMFALAAVSANMPEASALLGFLWAQAEGQVSAAVRLVPLGQTAGQNLLSKLVAILPTCAAAAAALSDAELGAFAPGLALASALHETQYTRLFRS